jgi:hypothetical protein
MPVSKKLLNRGFGSGTSPKNILTGGLGLSDDAETPGGGALNLINLGFGFGASVNDIITHGFDPHGVESPFQIKSAADTGRVIGTETAPVDKTTSVTDTSNVASFEITSAPSKIITVTDTSNVTLFDDTTNVVSDDVFFTQTDISAIGITESFQIVKSLTTTDTSQVVGLDTLQAVNIPPSLYIPDVSYATLDDVLRGLAGPLVYQVGLRHYDSDRVLKGELKNKVAEIHMDWDETRSVKRTLTFQYYPSDEHDELDRHEYIEPYIIYERPQLYGGTGVITEEVSFGLFTGLAHTIKLDLSSVTIDYTAYDLSTTLVAMTTSGIFTVPAGSGYDTIIRGLCEDAGFEDLDVVTPTPPTSVPSQMTWEAGTSFYNIVQKLGDAVNWEGPYVGLGETDVIYATDEESIILPDVQITHNIYDVVNNVVITVDDPMRTPFKVTYTNMNTFNPYSYTNTGILITQVYEDLDHMASSALALARAELIMQREHTPHTISLSTWLDFRRGFYELYTINAEQLEHIGNRWRCTGWAMNLSIGGAMTHNLVEVQDV